MPIYEYKCHSCQRTLEFIQKFSDPLLTECPNCQGKLEKLVSSPHFELKGTGWYVTDFKKSDKDKQATTNKTPSEETNVSNKTSNASADNNAKSAASTTTNE